MLLIRAGGMAADWRGASTPSLDALAEGGVTYTRAFSAAGSSAPEGFTALTGTGPQALFDALKAALKAQRGGGRWFADLGLPRRPFRNGFFPHARTPVDAAGVRLPAQLPDTPSLRTDWVDYLTAVQCVDALVGALLDALARSGQEEQTRVLFTAAHGPEFLRGQGSLYGFGVQVPLILRGPGVAENARRHELTVLESWEPAAKQTIALENEASRSVFDGRFRLILNKRTEFTVEPERRQPVEAAREAFPLQHDLLLRTLKRPAEELYDTASDPWEMRDLAADARFAAVKARLAKG